MGQQNIVLGGRKECIIERTTWLVLKICGRKRVGQAGKMEVRTDGMAT